MKPACVVLTLGAILAGDSPAQQPESNRLEPYSRLSRPLRIKFHDLEAAVASRTVSSALPMKLRADYIPLTESAVLTNITAQFENHDLNFQAANGVPRASVNLYGRITTMSWRVVNIFEDTVAVDCPPAMFQACLKRQVIYQKSVPLAPGAYLLNLAAKDVISGNLASYEGPLEVPGLETGKLSSSSLILADRIEKVPADRIGSGQFVIGEFKVRPRVDASFRRDEKMGIYVQFYNFTLDEQTHQPSASIEGEITRGGAGAAIYQFRAEGVPLARDSTTVTLQKFLSLQDLAPGRYTLLIRATDEKRYQTVTPALQFTVY